MYFQLISYQVEEASLGASFDPILANDSGPWLGTLVSEPIFPSIKLKVMTAPRSQRDHKHKAVSTGQ